MAEKSSPLDTNMEEGGEVVDMTAAGGGDEEEDRHEVVVAGVDVVETAEGFVGKLTSDGAAVEGAFETRWIVPGSGLRRADGVELVGGTLTLRDLFTLGGRLNDAVLAWMLERLTLLHASRYGEQAHVVSTHMFPCVRGGGRWKPRPPPLTRTVIVPIFFGNHWSVVVVVRGEVGEMYHYDSFATHTRLPGLVETLEKWYAETERRGGEGEEFESHKEPPPLTRYSVIEGRGTQTNGMDCGLFVVEFVRRFLESKGFDFPPITPQVVAEIRHELLAMFNPLPPKRSAAFGANSTVGTRVAPPLN